MTQTDQATELHARIAELTAERDRLKQELAEARVYKLAVEHAPIGMMCVSFKTGRYEFSNPTHAKMLGSTPEEVTASDPHRRWHEITHPDDMEREMADHVRLASGEISHVQSERRFLCKDGQVRWTHVDAETARDEDGRPAYLLVYMRDAHEQHLAAEAHRRLEAQLRQSRKLESLGRLAGGVAHDFNNRLLIILCYAEAVRAALPRDSALAQPVNMVLESAQRAADLTHQLLAFSRRQVLKPTTFDLNQVVEGMRKLLSPIIGDDIELVTSLAAKHSVFADAGQIEQVILNLAINARDAMPSGGRLLAETRDVYVPADSTEQLPRGDYVALIIEDTGSGIAPDVLPHVFDPFFTTKEVGAGTGLGLSTVEGIVRQSNGSVRAESELGKGARFTVLLPRATSAPEQVSRPRVTSPKQPIQFETVLVCDDDPAVRKLLAELLRIRAYQVLEAPDGRRAIEVAKEHGGRIDLLITDLVMPELGGMELARCLRTDLPELRVLYVSGYSDDQDLLAGAAGERALFLAKPFMPGDLVRAVHALLQEQPSPSVAPTEDASARVGM